MSTDRLHAHLATGLTHVCQCWSLRRRDGTVFGFTDHDRPLQFDGIVFAAESGMSAKALSASTGLSVNNTEAVGLLQSDVITDADIAAGRYDGAEVTIWRVCWDDVTAREVKFFGTIGEITRRAGTFEAELRGLTEMLNQPQGRSYLRSCSAVLGRAACGVDLNDPAFHVEGEILALSERGGLIVGAVGFAADWFAQGRLTVLSGTAEGLSAIIKTDVSDAAARHITLWEPVRGGIAVGDRIRLEAGCDRRAETCREKFSNFRNFHGFPHVPGDDWLVSVPRSGARNDGGSLNR